MIEAQEVDADWARQLDTDRREMPLNVSNDRFYDRKTQMVKRTLGQITHSLPAAMLNPLWFRRKMESGLLGAFHRPRLRIGPAAQSEFQNDPRMQAWMLPPIPLNMPQVVIKGSDYQRPVRLIPGKAYQPEKVSEMSARDGPLIVLEYLVRNRAIFQPLLFMFI